MIFQKRLCLCAGKALADLGEVLLHIHEQNQDHQDRTADCTEPSEVEADCGDHRIAMAAAAASVGCIGEVAVDDMSCTAKSYPDFCRDWKRLRQ